MPILISKVIKDLNVDFAQLKLFFDANGITYKNLTPQTKIKFEHRDLFAKSLLQEDVQGHNVEICNSVIDDRLAINGEIETIKIEEYSQTENQSSENKYQNTNHQSQETVQEYTQEADHATEDEDCEAEKESINIYLSFSIGAEQLFNRYNKRKFKEYISCLMNGNKYECHFFNIDEGSYKIVVPFVQYGGQLELSVKGDMIFQLKASISDCSVFTRPIIEHYEEDCIKQLCSFTFVDASFSIPQNDITILPSFSLIQEIKKLPMSFSSFRYTYYNETIQKWQISNVNHDHNKMTFEIDKLKGSIKNKENEINHLKKELEKRSTHNIDQYKNRIETLEHRNDELTYINLELERSKGNRYHYNHDIVASRFKEEICPFFSKHNIYFENKRCENVIQTLLYAIESKIDSNLDGANDDLKDAIGCYLCTENLSTSEKRSILYVLCLRYETFLKRLYYIKNNRRIPNANLNEEESSFSICINAFSEFEDLFGTRGKTDFHTTIRNYYKELKKHRDEIVHQAPCYDSKMLDAYIRNTLSMYYYITVMTYGHWTEKLLNL